MNLPRKALSVFSLVMINVIAVDSLRTLPLSAVLGLPLISFYLLAAVIFFIPVALVAAELATTYPQTGGIYIWVREAFGAKVGFLAIWFQWIYNIVWYPTILAFIVSASAYLFNPLLADNPTYLLMMGVLLFWLFTLLNAFGMRLSGFISILSAIVGTILPMTALIVFGGMWLFQHYPLAIDLHGSWLPAFHSWGDLALFPGILFGLLGMEMSATHAEEVRNPQRDYPRALAYSTLIIFSTLMFGSLSIILVIAPENLSVVSGLVDACRLFAKAYHLPWLPQLIACLIIVGALGSVSAWIIGPTKGLLAAAKEGVFPKALARVNRHGAPTAILFMQGVVFTVLCASFQLFDTLNASYWLLSDLCAQLALIVYVLMFAAAIQLRRQRPPHPGAYRIPGPPVVLYLVAGLGLLGCVGAILIGFIPPTQISIHRPYLFSLCLVGGIVITSLSGLGLCRRKNTP